jgi:hypothetical protein
MTFGFASPLPLIFARMVTQSGTAAAAWSGLWYGFAMGAIDAATRKAALPAVAAEPEAEAAKQAPPIVLARAGKPTGRRNGPARR